MRKNKSNEKQIIEVFVGNPELDKYSEYLDPSPVIKDRVLFDVRYCGFETIFEQMVEMKKKYGNKYTDLHFEEVDDCGCYHPCSCRPNFYLKGKRMESDLEFRYRIDQETKKAAAQEARDRAEYEKLKAKYDDKND